ncbi:hypothetical protein DAPPUDRAFT_241224 [Daphnia pulex]|uniref:Ionotropic glutamate receptor C-terminal domain-containing protein n=1 Tax=Daphnia pulex TaxID=6669 RepID=E9GDR1_DAPPU|nr:hypothetical protein DAPPUDRAFT_241224 [Daphnia pulex]|eukprot:EFX82126.1 hypothetical protein DAPPUDRAFT_241224 [Daphnia pulex]
MANIFALSGYSMLPRWEGNPKGLSGPLKGGVIIDYLAARLNFTYGMVRVTENRLEPEGKERGLFSYLFDKQSDLLVSAIRSTAQRNKIVDQTTPWEFTKLGLLIPVQDETANINAVVKPFQWPVWIGLITSILCVIAVLNLMQRYLEYRSALSETSNHEERINNPNKEKLDNRNTVLKSRYGKEYLYVFGLLLSQGGPCASKRLPFRLVAGVWILAAFIFVQAYTSLLFTYVVAPVNQPLINSIYDIADSSDINLLAEAYQRDAIRENFEKTGKCSLLIARDSYLTIFAVMALQKNSPYTDAINLGLMELQQSGLIDYWDLWFRPMPRQCQGKVKNGYKSTDNNQHRPLSLKNLTGAFIVLTVGISLSLLAFICEKIVCVSDRHRRHLLRHQASKKKLPNKIAGEVAQVFTD